MKANLAMIKRAEHEISRAGQSRAFERHIGRHARLAGEAPVRLGVFVHAVLDCACLRCRERLGEIDAGHLADEMPMKLSDRDRHGASP